MPSIVIPAGAAQLSFRFLVDSDPEEMVTTLGVVLSDPPSTPAVCAQFAYTAWVAAFPAADMADTYTFVGVTAAVGTGDDPILGEYVVPLAGTNVLSPPPNNTAVLVRKQTALGGRRNRGRMFIPPFNLSELNVNGAGVLASSFQTGMAGALNDLEAELTDAAGPFESLALFHSSAPFDATVVSNLVLQTRVATQRERMRR